MRYSLSIRRTIHLHTIISTWVTSDGSEYFIMVVADRALLTLDVGLADTTSRHLLAVLPNGAE